MKHASKRILAWLLCAVMLLALLPSFAAAEEDASPLDPPALVPGEPTEELPEEAASSAKRKFKPEDRKAKGGASGYSMAE